MTTQNLQQHEYNSFYSTYINKVPKDLELLEGFNSGGDNLVRFFKGIPEDKLVYRYADGKWSVKEVLQHIIDTERVFMHRCFRIARHDKTALPGFEQDDYIEPSHGHSKSFDVLMEEYNVNRKNSILLLRGLQEQDLLFMGMASGFGMSARAAAFATLGHELHHISILEDRYL